MPASATAPATAPTTALPRGRIEGLDLCRGLLMAAGLPVHASFGLARVPLFDVVEDASLGFRMGAFFALSGLLTALALHRRDAGEWFARRAVQLAVPATVAILCFSPLIWWLMAHAPAPVSGRPLLPFEWHHAWFLLALLFYSAVAVAIDTADRRWHVASAFAGGLLPSNGRAALLVVAGGIAVLAWAAGNAMVAWLPPRLIAPLANLQMVAGYLPMFLFGFALARSAQLCRLTLSSTRFAAAIVVACLVAYLVAALAPAALHHRMQPAVRFLVATAAPPAAFVLILRIALSLARIPAWARRLSNASYTIYLVHLPIMVALNTRWASMLDPHVAWALSVVVAGSIALLLHERLVTRSPALALLLNGRLPQRASAPQWTNRATTSR